MTAAYANEKLVIDLKAVVGDLLAVARHTPRGSDGRVDLRLVYEIIGITPFGRAAIAELRADRRRAAQGSQRGAHA